MLMRSTTTTMARDDSATYGGIVFAALLVLSFPPNCASFQASIHRFHPITTTRTSPLAAVVYGLSDDDADADYDSSYLSSYSASVLDRKVPSSLFSPDWTAPLARLATAHSTNALDIEQIHHVSVGRVDAAQLDIEAIVCERDDCVSLSVPVELPQPCTDTVSEESFEQCIVENLAVLDQANQKALAENKVFASEEDVELATRVHEELTTFDGIEYPDWWVENSEAAFETAEDIQKECTALCSILNEADFQPDLMQLVSSRCVFQEENIRPGQVYVLQIGLAGMIVRATALQNNGADLLGITEIPIPYNSNPASCSESLRECVLNLVEQ